MVFGTIDHLSQYLGLPEGVVKGLTFLAETDFSKLQEDTVCIDGDAVTASIKRYTTAQTNDTPEAHEKYIDIQYMIEGEEYIGVCPLADATEQVKADPQNDIWFYHAPVQPLLLKGKRFIVLWPDDAHAPGISVGEDTAVKKCVIKVRV